MKKLVSVIIIFLTLHAAWAQENFIEDWLVADGISVTLPSLANIKNVKGKTFEPIDLLKQQTLSFENFYPEEGKHIQGASTRWVKHSVNSHNAINLNLASNDYKLVLAAAYIETDGFWKGDIEVESTLPFELYVGENKIADRYSASNSANPVSKEVKLLAGNHLVMVKLLATDTLTGPSTLKVAVKPNSDFAVDKIALSTNPRQVKTLKHLLQGPKLSGVSVSTTGEMALITVSEMDTKAERNNFYRRVVRLSDSKTITSFRQNEVSQLKWMPKGNKLSYIANGNLWIYNFDSGIEKEVLKGLNDMMGYEWSPNEDFVIYNVYERDDSRKGDIKQILTMEDRQSHWRSRSFLYITHLSAGKHQRLTWGNQSTSLHDISPDGKAILFSISREDYSERPYRRQTLLQLNLNTLAIDTLWAEKLFATTVAYSPDGTKLLATGAPLAFGNVGVNVSDRKIPNGFDTQAYIYDIKTGAVDPITLNFDPSVRGAHWCPTSNNIYINTVDKEKNTVFEYNIRRKRFAPLDLREEMVGSLDFATGKPLAVYLGSGTNSWPKAYSIDLKTGKTQVVDDTDAVNYTHVKLGEVKDWEFVSERGQKVVGRYYLPPNFDPSNKYPTIVYYYGGTTPVGRDFGGRYPKQHYAANGFVVLVLQPSGTIGFGQDFSAAHVNAWGEITADEIIEGTKKFTAQHNFVNVDKIGCIGASYGGFMTMYLLTQTDIFAAAISHAGISSISSYWGEGFWGYSYSAEASANSFPWNNRELYVDRSPLFNAHKVVTPLLLLHGTDDTNVPVGESIQMFTALKLLGKPVDLIQVDGEDHHILKYSRRIEWTNTILAYFSKHLKDEQAWWSELYPEQNY
ncbi:alpha/beta hydrolase family protein [Perlabentimonas gracilis]|uniref:alpha/beta hydrolase family protein n=1 Tax=Perlabentimonas gracilis TaxID=2715279 RepID=UPI00140B5208|nr:prolyl oligopeptidase family serine peptidase [Perlabentimonas gracilis]NHB67985.1 S9 family peptidase [Perlabentimonas gracilis]